MRILAALFSILVWSSAQAELLTYSGGSNEPIGVSDGLLKMEFNYSRSHYTLDVINEFADQLRVESGSANDYELVTKYYFTKFIFGFLNYKFSQVEYEDSAVHELQEGNLDYHDYSIGGGYNWGGLSFKLAFGEARYHSFLETDTTFYFQDDLNSQYISYGVDYKFETAFGFDVEMFVDFQSYFESTVGSYDIEKGDVRKWGGRMVVSSGALQYGFGYTHTHRTVKMIHNFFSLRNEMNNKLLANQFLLFTGYGF